MERIVWFEQYETHCYDVDLFVDSPFNRLSKLNVITYLSRFALLCWASITYLDDSVGSYLEFSLRNLSNVEVTARIELRYDTRDVCAMRIS